MKTSQTAKFGVIVSNVRSGTNIMLDETFTTFNKCQAFVDKMNQKNNNSSIVFIATTNLCAFKKSQINKLFKKVE